MRWIVCVLSLFILLPSAVLSAQYKIGPLDKLQIKVHEWPLMTDTLSVSPEGNLTLPLIGMLRAEGLSVAELAIDISKRLQTYARLSEVPYTSVEVIQFRPFYVTGDVQRPGEYPYRPGMTVLMALSISGGLYRGPPTPMIRPSREVIASEGALADAEAKQRELLVKQAILTAELASRELNDSEIRSLQIKFKSPEIIKNQLFVSKERQKLFVDQISALRGRVEIYTNQIKYLRLQIESTIKQRQSVERELSTQQSLVEKGLGLAARMATLERLASQIEGDQRGLETLVTRSQDTIASFEAEIQKLTNERGRDGKIELAKLFRELEDVGSQMLTQRKLLAEAELLAATLRQGTSRRSDVRLTVFRDDDGFVRSFTVKNDDKLDPGDVLVIEERMLPSADALTYSSRAD